MANQLLICCCAVRRSNCHHYNKPLSSLQINRGRPEQKSVRFLFKMCSNMRFLTGVEFFCYLCLTSGFYRGSLCCWRLLTEEEQIKPEQKPNLTSNNNGATEQRRPEMSAWQNDWISVKCWNRIISIWILSVKFWVNFLLLIAKSLKKLCVFHDILSILSNCTSEWAPYLPKYYPSYCWGCLWGILPLGSPNVF